MKKGLIAGIVASVMILTCSAFAYPIDAKEVEEPEVEYITEVIEVDNSFKVETLEDFTDEAIDTYSLDQLKEKIAEQNENQEQAHALAESARALGWPETADAIQCAKVEWQNADLIKNTYQAAYDKLYEELDMARWDEKAAEYPAATEVWLYMKSLGWNDYVCAGILGNMMAECGGQTLALQPTVYSPGEWFYGLCQWSKKYFPDVQGQDIGYQCDYLRDTIKSQFDAFGFCYKSNFGYDQFLEITNKRDAAVAFAECYERCGSGTYYIRQQNATTAYNYFVN